MTDNSKTVSKKKIIIIVVAAVLVAAGAIAGIIFARQGYLATTMRLLKAEGKVNIEDSKGGNRPVADGLRFQSGDALNTGDDGYATIGLDDKKIVTLDHDSRAEFRKKNKQLELKVTEGAVFVNVAEKLKSDEKFEIKTSNMTAGIRGTLLWVYHDKTDNNREVAALLEGSAEISATNPVTKETKSTTIGANQLVKVYFYNNDGEHDDVEFSVLEFTPEDYSEFIWMIIGIDEDLVGRIDGQNNNWTKDKILEMARKIKNGGRPPKKNPETKDPEEKKPGESQKPVEPQDPEDPQNPENQENPENTGDEQQPKPTSKKPTRKKKTTTTKPKPKTPKVPSGYSKFAWKYKYKKKTVYVVVIKDGDTFKGWIKEKWVTLKYDMQETDTGYKYTFTYKGNTYCVKTVPYE